MGVKSYNLKLGSRHPDTQHLHPNLCGADPPLSAPCARGPTCPRSGARWWQSEAVCDAGTGHSLSSDWHTEIHQLLRGDYNVTTPPRRGEVRTQ